MKLTKLEKKTRTMSEDSYYKIIVDDTGNKFLQNIITGEMNQIKVSIPMFYEAVELSRKLREGKE